MAILLTDMHTHITAFEVKVRLWEAQLANGQALLHVYLMTWSRTLALVPSPLSSLRDEFASRFAGVMPL